MKFKLDFSIFSSEERTEAVRQIIEQNPHLTKSELDTLSNYILYGKDSATGTSVVDRKEVQIKSKFNSYQKEKIVSLDEMMESPTFNEAELEENQVQYKQIKPHIDKEKAKLIPFMADLWQQIETQQDILDQNIGKIPLTTAPQLNQRQQYLLKHHLIQLRTQQYYLMDSFFPAIGHRHNYLKYYGDLLSSQMVWPVYPRGTAKKENDQDFTYPFYSEDPAPAQDKEEEKQKRQEQHKPFFDFLDSKHLQVLVKNWRDIEAFVEDEPGAPLWELLWTFNIYQGLADLNEQQEIILEGKKKGLSGVEIQDELREKLGISHQVNYISTIYMKAIKKIQAAVELNYDEWLAKDYGKAWKKCKYCGQWQLRDPRRFCRRGMAVEGLVNRCKKCDERKRQGLKYITWDVEPPKQKITKEFVKFD